MSDEDHPDLSEFGLPEDFGRLVYAIEVRVAPEGSPGPEFGDFLHWTPSTTAAANWLRSGLEKYRDWDCRFQTTSTLEVGALWEPVADQQTAVALLQEWTCYIAPRHHEDSVKAFFSCRVLWLLPTGRASQRLAKEVMLTSEFAAGTDDAILPYLIKKVQRGMLETLVTL